MHENAYIKNQPAAANVFFPLPKNFANVYMKTEWKNENAYKITHEQQWKRFQMSNESAYRKFMKTFSWNPCSSSENAFMKISSEAANAYIKLKTAGGNDKWKRLHFYENWMDLPFKPINENVYILTTSPENDIIYM